MRFIIQRKRTGMYFTNIAGKGLGGSLWTNNVKDASVFTGNEDHCLKSLAPNYGKCVAVAV